MNRGPDDAILELLDETDMALTPKVMAFQIEYDYTYLRQRLRVLKEHGLIAYPEETPTGVSRSGVYEVTSLGRRFLSGDATREELELVSEVDEPV